MNMLIALLCVGVCAASPATPPASPPASAPAPAAPAPRAPTTPPHAAPTPPAGLTPPALGTWSEVLERMRAKHGVAGLVAGCVTPGGVEAIEAVGVRRLGSPQPLLASDRMHLGSCTKAFTATLAAALVADGTLTWGSTVAQVLGATEPGMDAGWKDITLEDLLRHRGGAPAQPHPDDWRTAWECTDSPEKCREAFVRSMLTRPPAQKRGEFAYSNQGYALAGRMCEVATGAPYETLLRARVLAPLGITDADFGAPTRVAPDAPSGHQEGGAPSEVDNPPSIAPAGTLHMPVEQWMKFIAFHMGVTPPAALVGAASHLAALHRAGETPPNEGMGWLVTPRPWGGAVLTHAGSNRVWYCVAWVSPERTFAVVAACNQGGAAATRACDEACAAMIQAHLARPNATPPQSPE